MKKESWPWKSFLSPKTPPLSAPDWCLKFFLASLVLPCDLQPLFTNKSALQLRSMYDAHGFVAQCFDHASSSMFQPFNCPIKCERRVFIRFMWIDLLQKWLNKGVQWARRQCLCWLSLRIKTITRKSWRSLCVLRHGLRRKDL